MKLLQLLLSPRIGGAETLAAGLAESWTTLAHEELTMYLDPPAASSGKLARILRIRELARAYAPDAVVAHSYLPNLYARVALGNRIPVHCVLHSAVDDFCSPASRGVERLLSYRTTSIIAVANSQRDQYRHRFGDCTPLTVIANGVRGSIHPKKTSRPSPERVVTVARFSEQKRPDVWLSVAREALIKAPELTFEWWGPHPDTVLRDNLAANLPPNAFLRGPTNDVSGVLAESDIVLHTADREAHSVSLMEAIVSGTPLIYADSVERPGPEEVWGHQFVANSSHSAIDLLLDFRRDWQQRSTQAVAFAQVAVEEFDVMATATRYLDWINLHAGSQAS